MRSTNLAPGINEHASIDVSAFSSENFQVRFLFSGLLLSSEVYIDTVEILGELAESTTTTTTTVPQTTTTTAPTTTTTQPTTTTTRPGATTSTSTPGSGSPVTTIKAQPGSQPPTTTTVPGNGDGSTTSTTPESTASSIVAVGPGGPGGGPDQGGPDDEGTSGDGSTDGFGPGGSGIRAAARGLQANFQGDLYGEVRTVSALNGVDFRVDFSMAVEVIEASWAWIVLLGLVIAYSIISGLDRRKVEPEEISQAAR